MKSEESDHPDAADIIATWEQRPRLGVKGIQAVTLRGANRFYRYHLEVDEVGRACGDPLGRNIICLCRRIVCEGVVVEGKMESLEDALARGLYEPLPIRGS